MLQDLDTYDLTNTDMIEDTWVRLTTAVRALMGPNTDLGLAGDEYRRNLFFSTAI
ncbi:hypothetical protein DPMN_050693 [Dreissena polymorpha]|uniref:Uncharacterized protein n=1 Tax=Dreissena polymorpha TaxID=45954 RepID=A0A9D4CIK0_DREPO|nr:hypothetical protein DPMN_050693 [Dreissena polymorpha]